MISWADKAKAHFSQTRQEQAPETPERGVMGVMGVRSQRIHEKHAANDADEAALLEALLTEVELACDYWQDGPAARQQMRDDILAAAKHQWRDLLEYFRAQYRQR